MHKPYTVEGKLFPVVAYEGDPVISFGLLGMNAAKECAINMNSAFVQGVFKVCTVTNEDTSTYILTQLGAIKNESSNL